jgi:hypothetical protein
MLSLAYQGFTLLLVFSVTQCENKEQKDEYSKNSHNVLQNGRIISKPVSYQFFIFLYLFSLYQECLSNTCRSNTTIRKIPAR